MWLKQTTIQDKMRQIEQKEIERKVRSWQKNEKKIKVCYEWEWKREPRLNAKHSRENCIYITKIMGIWYNTETCNIKRNGREI